MQSYETKVGVNKYLLYYIYFDYNWNSKKV